MYDFSTPGPFWWTKPAKKGQNFGKSLIYFSTREKNKETYGCMMSIKASTKIVKFMAPRLVILTLERGQYGYIIS